MKNTLNGAVQLSKDKTSTGPYRSCAALSDIQILQDTLSNLVCFVWFWLFLFVLVWFGWFWFGLVGFGLV